MLFEVTIKGLDPERPDLKAMLEKLTPENGEIKITNILKELPSDEDGKGNVILKTVWKKYVNIYPNFLGLQFEILKLCLKILKLFSKASSQIRKGRMPNTFQDLEMLILISLQLQYALVSIQIIISHLLSGWTTISFWRCDYGSFYAVSS